VAEWLLEDVKILSPEEKA